MPPPTFLFTTCREGSEARMKKEIGSRYAGLLTPAFMRPQLITWKIQQPLPRGRGFHLESLYALRTGASLGMAKAVSDIPALVTAADAEMAARPRFLHVFPREVPEDGVPEETWTRVDAVQAELREMMGTTEANRRPIEADLGPNSRSSAGMSLGRGVSDSASAPWFLNEANRISPGDLVLDVIVGAEGEPMLVGLHEHRRGDFKRPGGLLRTTLPAEAPSRAWLKMEQALDWLEIADRMQGRTVLELGCAPGGASWSLLQRGATVIGVDTGEMDPRVLAHRGFDHLRLPAGDLTPSMVPETVDLIVSDMNLEPRLVYLYVEKFARRLRPRKLVLTLKINSAQVESELPEVIARIQDWAPGPVTVRQLPANRQEVTLVAWGEE